MKNVVGGLNHVATGITKGADNIVKGTVTGVVDAVKDSKKLGDKLVNTATDFAEDVGFLPPLTPMPMHQWLILLVIVALPITGYCIIFSEMFYGVVGMKFAVENAELGSLLLFIVACVFASLYILDAEAWESKGMLWLRFCILCLTAVTLVVGIFFSASDYAYAPLMVFMIAMPPYLIGFRLTIFKENFRLYVSWLPGPLFILALTWFVWWLVWCLSGSPHEWTPANRNRIAFGIRCPPNFDSFPKCENHYVGKTWNCSFEGVEETKSLEACPTFLNAPDTPYDCSEVYDTCLDAFLIWSTPFLVSLVYFFFSFIFAFLNPDHKEATPQAFMKTFMMICFMFWVASSLAASNAGITSALMAFITMALLCGAMAIIGVHGFRTASDDIAAPMMQKLKSKYGGYSTFFKGFFIITCGPTILIYWAISFLNQLVRKLGMPLSKQLTEGDKKFALTITASRQKAFMLSWEWTSVLTMAVNIGIFVQVMSVLVTKFTYLGLAMLKDEISSWEIWQVTLMLISVGLFLFMLPPVPGVPIYFMAGTMLVGVCEDKMGLVGATIYATLLGIVLKVFACMCQQNVIGKTFKGKVGIRQLVGINSNMIRTMRVILSRPGMSIAKCAILVGGPDWPTSVLCGIMGLDLIPILIGTLPVALLIAPTTLSGVFVYMSGAPHYKDWASTLSTVCISATGMAQSGSMVVAAFYLEEAMTKEKEAIDAIPIDKEVEEADERAKVSNAKFVECTKFSVLPGYMRCWLITSTFLMTVSCYMVMVFSSQCFSVFSMSDTVEKALDGDPWKLVKGPGYVAIALFLTSSIMQWVFYKWAAQRVKGYVPKATAVREDSLVESNTTL